MKPEVDLELSISALRAYGVEPAIINNILENLAKVVGRKAQTPHNCPACGSVNYHRYLYDAKQCQDCETVFDWKYKS